jgi:microcystin-dependent protein
MEPNYEALAASDGSGEPIRATVQSPGREKGSMVIPVNATTNWPNGTFIATTGTLLANGTLSPTTAQVFYGTADETNVTITSFAAGYTDQGNLTDDVVVLKPTTEWANIVQDAISNITPSGVMMPFAGATAPAGYLLAQGQAVSRTTYSALFTAISTTYGDGDGSTTFNLPDLRSRSPVGAGTGVWSTTFPASGVNTGTSQITVPANSQIYTGTPLLLTAGGTAPGGLATATIYYAIVINSTTIQLASSLLGAVAGTAITLTSQGAGTNTLGITLDANTLGTPGGEVSHALKPAELPALQYSVGAGAGGNYSSFLVGTSSITNQGMVTNAANGAHNNRSPYLTVNYIIKT